MGTTDIITATVWEDGGATLMARILDNDGTALKQADIDGTGSITYNLYDEDGDTPNTAISGPTTLDEAVVIKDPLETTDDRWTVDTTGYNFIHIVAASELSSGGNKYRIEIKFIPDSGEAFHAVFILNTKHVRSG